jgi:hypothetical protein
MVGLRSETFGPQQRDQKIDEKRGGSDAGEDERGVHGSGPVAQAGVAERCGTEQRGKAEPQ